LPITFPQCLDDTPAKSHYPGGGGKMEYGEGVFVGYRWYDSRDIEPLFAFGHGLSYTTFEFTELALGAFDSEEGAIVTLELTNTGQLFGMETVQVYVEPISSPVARPRRELKGFTKVALAPGARERVELTLDPPSFAHWDVERSQWLAAPGRYRVCVGNSSRNILLEDELTIEA
jgi:beta-glucosidase